MSSLAQEAVDYFRGRPGYDRLLVKIRQRYQSLGRIGGSVRMEPLSEEEKQALGALFGKDYSRQSSARIQLAAFEQALARSRFARVSVVELLENYFEEEIVTREEAEQNFHKRWEELYADLLERYPDADCQQWLGSLQAKEGYGYQMVLKRCKEDWEEARQQLKYLCQALTALPVKEGQRERIPIFAAQITTDPHSFDQGTELGNLLLTALVTIFQENRPQSSEMRMELLLKAGIIQDDISSYVTTYGLLAERDGQKHPLWEGAFISGEVLQLTLRNLLQVDRVVSRTQRVFVVENPSVFSEILDRWGSQERELALICSNGQFRLAFLILLDLLVESGVEIYYSGDFDPEGIGMAQRLLDRYPGQVQMWRLGLDDYRRARSDNLISKSRLKKLESVEAVELAPVVQEMLEVQRAGYQEHLVTDLWEDVLGMAES